MNPLFSQNFKYFQNSNWENFFKNRIFRSLKYMIINIKCIFSLKNIIWSPIKQNEQLLLHVMKSGHTLLAKLAYLKKVSVIFLPFLGRVNDAEPFIHNLCLVFTQIYHFWLGKYSVEFIWSIHLDQIWSQTVVVAKKRVKSWWCRGSIII